MQSHIEEVRCHPLRMTGKYVSQNVISMLALSLYILADTFFIANGVGSNGLVALNIALPAFALMNGAGLLVGMGGATHFAISLGEGKQERAGTYFTNALWMILLFGLVFTLAGAFFSRPIMAAFGATSDILPMAASYFQTIFLFSFAFLLNNCLVAFVRNDGAPQLSMAAMMTASFSNIILDYVFVYPLGMGMFGAAFATGLAPILSMLVLLLHFLPKKARKNNRVRPTFALPSLSKCLQIIGAGMPSFLTEVSNGIVILVFNLLLLRLSGNTAVAAYGILSNIALVCAAIFNGIGQGIQPVVSVLRGAGKSGMDGDSRSDQENNLIRNVLGEEAPTVEKSENTVNQPIKKVRRLAWLIALGFGILFYLSGVLFPDALISWFNKDGDLLLQQTARHAMALYFLAFLPMGINTVTISAFAATMRPQPAFWLSLTRGLVGVFLLAAFFPALFGIEGIWLMIPCTEGAALLGSMWLFLQMRKKRSVSAN